MPQNQPQQSPFTPAPAIGLPKFNLPVVDLGNPWNNIVQGATNFLGGGAGANALNTWLQGSAPGADTMGQIFQPLERAAGSYYDSITGQIPGFSVDWTENPWAAKPAGPTRPPEAALPGFEDDSAGNQGFDPLSMFGQGGGYSLGPSYESDPIDYTAGFPEAPQEAPTDWSAINAQFEQSRPKAPSIDPAQGWMAFLGAAAQAASGASTFGQALAAAGGGGLLGLLEQKQRDQVLDLEYQQADSQWQMAKAQIMQAQNDADREIARNNMNAAFQRQIDMHKLILQGQMDKQTEVTSLGGGSLMVKTFNPQSGKVEYQTHTYTEPTSVFEQLSLMRALKGDSELDLGDYGSIDLSSVPPELRGAYTVSQMIASGLLPPTVFGPTYSSAIEELFSRTATNEGDARQRMADLNGFLLSPEGQPVMQMALEILSAGNGQ